MYIIYSHKIKLKVKLCELHSLLGDIQIHVHQKIAELS